VSLRAVLFDLGNTLLFLDYDRMAPAVSQAIGVPLTSKTLAAQAKPAALALERADTTDRERATVYLEQLFLLAGVPDAKLPEVRDALLRLHQERHLWSGHDSRTPEALDRLRAAGFRLGVVSNSDGRAEEALVAAGLRTCFEVVVDSQLVGFEKPDPRIFHLALKQMGVRPDEAVYVGDIYEVDVVGARRAGMSVVLVDPLSNHTGRDVTSVRSIAELADHLLTQPRGS
jgi:putative hydrolase of the HAD superfamily